MAPPSKADRVLSPLEAKLSQSLSKRKAQSKLRQLKSNPPGTVDFSSNDFLSLSTTPLFREDFLAELQRVITPVGSTGSRLLDGNSQFAEQLEADIAQFHGAEAGLLTNSGFDANVSIFMCLPQPKDIVVYDELIHASVHDGMRQSRARDFLCFKHNDVDDLREILLPLSAIPATSNVFVAVETVYSMEGDVAPLRDIVTLTEELFPAKNCHIIVDEAHTTGVFGEHGRGIVSQLGLEKKIAVRLHTFGKALACNGAIILSSNIIKQYLLNYARPLIYTTFMSYASLTAIRVSYNWLQNGRTDKLAQHLMFLVQYMFDQFRNLQTLSDVLPAGMLCFPVSRPESPIFAILSTQPRILASYCQDAGFLVRAVVAPTVPQGTERVRVCLHAGNTVEEIDALVNCIRSWIKYQALEQTQSPSRSESGFISNFRDRDNTVLLAKL